MLLDYNFFNGISWSYVRGYYNQCDLITSPSETTRQELLKHKFNKNIITISNGIELNKFDNSNWKNVKERYNPHGKLILFVGRIGYEKNLLYLLTVLN
jgi:glycosyltransferase involved in cell wall biosynthesis